MIATAAARDAAYVRGLGAETVLDYKARPFEEVVGGVDAVIDTVGGKTRERSFQVIKSGGILVSSVSPIPPEIPKRLGIRTVFFLVEVTTPKLEAITELFEQGELVPHVGTVLALEQARTAHEMLAGAAHKPGKVVLKVAA